MTSANPSTLAKRLRLYVITDRRMAGQRSDEEIVRAALEGGATCIQLRAKELSTRQQVALGRLLRDLCHRWGRLFIVNDRLDVALAVQADGVHLGADDMPVAIARQMLGPDAVIGASAEDVAQARRAEQEGASYLGVGPVFPTATKPDAGPPIGLDRLAEIARAVNIPVVAIGGINRDNAPQVLKAGASGVAVISAVVAAPDPRAATQQLARAVGL